MMVKVRTAWIAHPAGLKPTFHVYPEETPDGLSQEDRLLFLTNDPGAFEDLFSGQQAAVADIMAVRAFAFTQMPLERAEQLFASGDPSAEGLWRAWEAMDAKLSQFPLWALETIELLLRDLGESALSSFFNHCSHRVRQSGRNCGNWLDAFLAENLRVERKPLPSHSECSPLAPDRMMAPLLPGGALAQQMAQYEARPGQMEMLKSVTRAFNEGKHLIVEAGTGVGKSLAYLIPSAAWARLNDLPVVVSTNTRNLQSQLIEKDLPLVRAAIRAEWGEEESQRFRVAVLKGRSNYLCLRQFGLLLEHSQFELDRPELRLFAEAVAWAVQTDDGDLDAFAGAGHADTAFLAKLASTGEECQGRGCRYFRRCFLQKARARALGAHLVIVNHALVFSDVQSEGNMLPQYAQMVFDEAHNLEEAATRHLSVEVTPYRLNQILLRLTRSKGKRAIGLLEVLRTHLDKGAITADDAVATELHQQIRVSKKAIEAIRETARALFEQVRGLLGGQDHPIRYRCAPENGICSAAMLIGEAPLPKQRRFIFKGGAFIPSEPWLDEAAVAADREALRQAIGSASVALTALADLLRRASSGELALYGDQAASVEGAVATLKAFSADVQFLLDGQDPEFVFWAESAGRHGHGQVNLIAAPLKISTALAERLYKKKTSIIFCSATLRVGGSFQYIGRRLGFDCMEPEQVLTCVAESPFNYQRQCAALALTFLPEPAGPEGGSYVEQLSGLMLDLFLKTGGRALGLFTSYEMMNQVARLLEGPLQAADIRLLIHGASGTRDQLTRIFRSGGRCVLLGTHSFWEGVDVAGEALSCVVMARLPFAAVGDPIVEARCEQIEQAGGSSFREFSVPQAVIRFRQGFGRLIRTCTDKGIVVIADPRLVTKNYGSIFARSLPCAVRQIKSRDAMLEAVGTFFEERDL